MPGSIWTVLGISPTQDVGEIRKAYARRLRALNVEQQAEEFRLLRSAYEQALDKQTFDEADGAPGTLTDDLAPELRQSRGSSHPGRDPEPAPVENLTSGDDADVVPELAAREGLDNLGLARRRLEAIVCEKETSSQKEQLEVLRSLLGSRALESIAVSLETEEWLADLILSNAPRSDSLIDPCAERFDWGSGARQRNYADNVRRVLERADDLRVIRRVQGNKAWEALTRPYRRSPLPELLGAPLLPGKVRALLDFIHVSRPRLLAEFDPKTLAWWEKYLSRPRFPPAGWWAVGLSMICFWPVVLSETPRFRDEPMAAMGVSFAASAALAFVFFYGLGWSRHLWRTRLSHSNNHWIRLAWIPAITVTLLFAVLAPTWWPLSALVLAASFAAAVWAIAVGDVDRRNVIARWLIAIYDGCGLLAFWWVFLRTVVPPPIYWRLTAPVVAAFIATTWESGFLNVLWLHNPGLRRRWLLVAGGLGLMSVGLIQLAADQSEIWPLAGAAVAVTILAQRGPAFVVGREFLMLRGIFTVCVLVSFGLRMADETWPRSSAVVPLGLMVLGSAVIVPIAMWIDPILARRRARRLKGQKRGLADL
jgi:hypothetical protein